MHEMPRNVALTRSLLGGTSIVTVRSNKSIESIIHPYVCLSNDNIEIDYDFGGLRDKNNTSWFQGVFEKPGLFTPYVVLCMTVDI